MTEGLFWRSVAGTVHIERPDGRYWCGFQRQPKHQQVTAAMLNTDDFMCARCKENKAKAEPK